MRCGAMFFEGRNGSSNSFPSTILCMVSGIWPSPGPKNHQNQRIGPYFCYRKVASRRSETIPQVRAPKFRLRPTPSDRRNRQPGPGQTDKHTNRQTNTRETPNQAPYGMSPHARPPSRMKRMTGRSPPPHSDISNLGNLGPETNSSLCFSIPVHTIYTPAPFKERYE